jgi:DNA polymerase-3 subunit alpha
VGLKNHARVNLKIEEPEGGRAPRAEKKEMSGDDIENISLEDEKTFSMLARGETMGLFQLNGSGMTRFLKELKPTTIFDINAMVALYRPGPLEMIPEYIRRKQDASLISYLDPRLEPILDQSFGVIVYQDDVMLIAIHLAGYSWLEADKLRKAMGKKIPAEMQAQKEKLFQGFLEHGLSAKKSQELWSQIEPFAAYGFNKAHAASYGRVAYQTAYMKANFPVAYMTAILSNESGDVEKISEIVSECKRMGIIVLPPDINKSEGGFSIVVDKNGKEEIRFGLYTVKNLGVDISDAIIAERKKAGPFTSFENFIRRITHKNLNKKSLEALTMCGALDHFGERNEILANIENILEFHKHVVKDNIFQDSLFDVANDSSFVMKKVPAASQKQKLTWEKELLGLFVSGFPLDPWKEKIVARNLDIEKVQSQVPDGKEVSLAVIIENIKITITKKGDKMGLLKLRDYTGFIEVAIFPEGYKRYKDLIIIDTPLVIKGKVSTRNGEKTIGIDEIKKLEISG